MTTGARSLRVVRRFGVLLYEPAAPAAASPAQSAYEDGIPHCDASVLHAPGACRYCDLYPARQHSRVLQRINFTGETDPDKAPCPSEYFREPSVRDRWPGNVARP